MSTSHPRISLLLLCALAPACSTEADVPSADDATFRVQYDRMFNMFEVAAAPAGAAAEALMARGSIQLAHLDANGDPVLAEDGTPVRFTCGAILIGPSYVVTAGHCVSQDDVPDPKNTPITLEMYPVEADLDWQAGMELTTPGAWYEFTHDMLGPADGYHTEQYDCRLIQRCGELWGDEVACDLPKADVALLRCDGLPGDKYGFVPVADKDLDGADLLMPWAHEVYDFAGDMGDVIYDHYNTRDPIEQSIHYMGGGRNQLLPLVNPGWLHGDIWTANTKLGYDDALGVRWTDLLGCHGTSGSPVLQWNAVYSRYEYLGPISRGRFGGGHVPGGMDEGNQLCQEPTLHDRFEENLAYSQLDFTKEVEKNADDCSPLYDKGPILKWKCMLHKLDLVWEEIEIPGNVWPCLTCPPPWAKLDWGMEPLVPITPERSLRVPVTAAEGTRQRISAVVVPRGDKAALVTMSNAAGERLAAVEVGGDTVRYTALQATLEVRAGDELRFSVEGGEARITRIAIAPADVANGFERAVDRAGVGMRTIGDETGETVAMRFAAEGKQDFTAVLRRGERMTMIREAVPADTGLSLEFAAAGRGSVRAGFVLADGSEVGARIELREGGNSVAFDKPASPPVAVFIDAEAVEGDILVDDVRVGG